ncbi:hypothetical protein ALP14_200112 [Pseudomonas amygdali pv. myricae]|nr:hypothetical protein ALP18_200291 [Pseudomonas amygdali pv. myricae]RMV30167.1 hypothetical protein ALP14_200112 [Pseudomonas amygdali pv. myricae]
MDRVTCRAGCHRPPSRRCGSIFLQHRINTGGRLSRRPTADSLWNDSEFPPILIASPMTAKIHYTVISANAGPLKKGGATITNAGLNLGK